MKFNFKKRENAVYNCGDETKKYKLLSKQSIGVVKVIIFLNDFTCLVVNFEDKNKIIRTSLDLILSKSEKIIRSSRL